MQARSQPNTTLEQARGQIHWIHLMLLGALLEVIPGGFIIAMIIISMSPLANYLYTVYSIMRINKEKDCKVTESQKRKEIEWLDFAINHMITYEERSNPIPQPPPPTYTIGENGLSEVEGMYSANPTCGVTVSLQAFPKPPSSKPARQFGRHIAGPDGDDNDTYAGPANRYAAPKDTSEIPLVYGSRFAAPVDTSLDNNEMRTIRQRELDAGLEKLGRSISGNPFGITFTYSTPALRPYKFDWVAVAAQRGLRH